MITLGLNRPDTDWEPRCLAYRGVVLTGYAAHCCPEWDGLPIDETCIEYPCCGVLQWLKWWQRPIVAFRSWRAQRAFAHESGR